MKMSTMTEYAQQYLEFKRNLGYQLGVEGKELLLFARYADEMGREGPAATEIAVRGAKLPRNADPVHWARRYEVVCRFAEHRFPFDSGTEIPPKRLLGSSKRRLSPRIYPDEEIASLLQAASRLNPANSPHSRTCVTLFGPLVGAGLRISEALNLSREDLDFKSKIITVTRTKFKKSRLVPIGLSTSQVLRACLTFRDACHPGAKAEKFLVGEKGIALNYRRVLYVFMDLRLHPGWTGTGKRTPRIRA